MNPFGAGTLIVIPSISNVDKYPEFISLVETVDDTLSIFGGFFFALMYITVAEIIENNKTEPNSFLLLCLVEKTFLS